MRCAGYVCPEYPGFTLLSKTDFDSTNDITASATSTDARGMYLECLLRSDCAGFRADTRTLKFMAPMTLNTRRGGSTHLPGYFTGSAIPNADTCTGACTWSACCAATAQAGAVYLSALLLLTFTFVTGHAARVLDCPRHMPSIQGGETRSMLAALYASSLGCSQKAAGHGACIAGSR